MWAMSLSSRLLFEWVWDGIMLYIVQMDNADPIGGVEPNELLPTTVDQLSPADLSLFCSANDVHYQQYGKLRNARVYRDIGYRMPEFYILAQKDVISSILQGVVPDALMADLEKLTRRPLMLRTDGLQLPDEKREMLPRSEELRSAEAAKSWLLDGFAPKIHEMALSTMTCALSHITSYHRCPRLGPAPNLENDGYALNLCGVFPKDSTGIRTIRSKLIRWTPTSRNRKPLAFDILIVKDCVIVIRAPLLPRMKQACGCVTSPKFRTIGVVALPMLSGFQR